MHRAAAEPSPIDGLLEEADCFNRSLATRAAQDRMARFLAAGGQTPSVERDLDRLIDRLDEIGSNNSG